MATRVRKIPKISGCTKTNKEGATGIVKKVSDAQKATATLIFFLKKDLIVSTLKIMIDEANPSRK